MGTTDNTEHVAAADVRPGDMIDMEPHSDDPAAPFEYARVTWVERETADCVRIDFTEFSSHGFDPATMLDVIRGTEADAALWADDPNA